MARTHIFGIEESDSSIVSGFYNGLFLLGLEFGEAKPSS